MTDTPEIPDELIEREARRMCVAMGLDPDEPGPFHAAGEYHFNRWKQFRSRARDALAAAEAQVAELRAENARLKRDARG
jgi:acyl-CoA-binding protein